MHVTYRPEGEPEQTWEFRPGRVRTSEAAAAERQFSGSWDEFVIGVQQGSVRARRVLLWLLMRRTHPGLRLDDMPDFYTDELEVAHTTDELLAMRERLQKTSLPPDQLDAAMAQIEVAMSDAMEREGSLSAGLEGAEGKAPSTPPSTNGG